MINLGHLAGFIMGKKKQLQSKSAAVEARRKKNRKIVSAVKVNPFEVRINKSKYAIIGRRLKHDRGLPGLSRSKAIKKVLLWIITVLSLCLERFLVGLRGMKIIRNSECQISFYS